MSGSFFTNSTLEEMARRNALLAAGDLAGADAVEREVADRVAGTEFEANTAHRLSQVESDLRDLEANFRGFSAEAQRVINFQASRITGLEETLAKRRGSSTDDRA